MTISANVRTADRVIEQFGTGLPDDREGCVLVALSAAQEKRLHDLLDAGPTAGITLSAAGQLAALPASPPPPADPIDVAERPDLDAFMAAPPGSASPAQRDRVLKAIIRRLGYKS